VNLRYIDVTSFPAVYVATRFSSLVYDVSVRLQFCFWFSCIHCWDFGEGGGACMAVVFVVFVFVVLFPPLFPPLTAPFFRCFS